MAGPGVPHHRGGNKAVSKELAQRRGGIHGSSSATYLPGCMLSLLELANWLLRLGN